MGILTNSITNINKNLTEQLDLIEINLNMLGHEISQTEYFNNSTLIYIDIKDLTICLVIEKIIIRIDTIDMFIRPTNMFSNITTTNEKINTLVSNYKVQSQQDISYATNIQLLINTLNEIIKLWTLLNNLL